MKFITDRLVNDGQAYLFNSLNPFNRDKAINEGLRIVTGCLKPTPIEYLPALSGIPPAELRRIATTTLRLARQSLELSHAFHNYITRTMAIGLPAKKIGGGQ